MRKVSIVVPTYNQVSYVRATLDHILHQDYPHLEVIVTDDASTDGTRDVLLEYQDRIERDKASFASRVTEEGTVEREVHERYPQNREFRLLLHEKNVGATGNYNRGFDQITGEYCTFIVGDDLPHPEMISSLVRSLEEEKADFVYSDMHIVDDRGNILRRFSLPDYSFERSFADWYLCGVSKLFRSRLLQADRFNPKYQLANDYDLFSRFAMKGARFFHLPRVLYSVRYHGEDRKVGLHSLENEARILAESTEIANLCRSFLKAREVGHENVRVSS